MERGKEGKESSLLKLSTATVLEVERKSNRLENKCCYSHEEASTAP